MEIYSRIEKHSHTELSFLNNHVNALCEIIQQQNDRIKELCDTFSIDHSGFICDVPSMNSGNNANDCDNEIMLINKLAIPFTAKDARRIARYFVTGLVCPLVNKHHMDGYAYVLPSDILPIAIATGVTFEHIDINRNFLNQIHQRLIFNTRYVKDMVNKFKESN